MAQTSVDARNLPFKGELSVDKMPAHWLMARLGKRVLRPGGLETTRWLLGQLAVGMGDDVIELAPGLGVTARQLVARGPRSYLGVERDPQALEVAFRAVAASGHAAASVVLGDAAAIPAPDAVASVVVGEAMLSMQTPRKKAEMMREAARVLRPGGRYAIHELALTGADARRTVCETVQEDLSRAIHVGVRIGTVGEWEAWLDEAGFDVEDVTTAPMRLLEPDRLLQDEGAKGAARFLFNTLRTPGALSRLRDVRATFRRHQANLCGVGIVARLRG